MERKRRENFEPLQVHLKEEIHPGELADLLEELSYDYVRIIIHLQQSDGGDWVLIHPETTVFLYHLRVLRNALRKCHRFVSNGDKINEVTG